MKQFSPHIYPEWGELISDLSTEKQAEIFNAILKYPNIDVDSGIWRFIKSQIDKDYDRFQERCNKNKEISNNYWKNKNIQTDTERLTNDTERLPNDILNININKNDNINQNDNDNVNNNIYDYETLFFDFWNSYVPVKCDGKTVNKGSRKLSFEKFVETLKSGVKYETIINGMQTYLEYCRKNNQFSCNVPTFFSQQRWADDYNSPSIDAERSGGQRQEPKSFVEIYSEITDSLPEEDNIH